MTPAARAGAPAGEMEHCGDEENLSAQSCPAQAQSWLPRAHEDAGWPGHPEAAAQQGAKAARRLHAVEVAMVARTGRLQRSDRIRHSRDFQRIARVGRRLASEYFVILIAPQDEMIGGPSPRLGVTVSRKVGGAVVRNRVKRRVREWFRTQRNLLPGPVDLVVIARSGAAGLGGPEVVDVLSQMLRRNGAGGEP